MPVACGCGQLAAIRGSVMHPSWRDATETNTPIFYQWD